MVSQREDAPGRWRFVLRPNCSATPTQIALFFAGIAAVSLTIAIAFALAGFWPVLPFAGAELLALWVCLRLSAQRAQSTQVIEIDDESVAVESARRARRRRWLFQRAWARIRLEAPTARLHPSRLLIGSHGRHVRLGAFLTEDERVTLARDLRNTLART